MSHPLLYGRRKLLLKGARTTVALLRYGHHNSSNDETRVWVFSEGFTQGFVDSIFKLMGLPLKYPDYSLLSKRVKTVNISIKRSTRGKITHLVIDSTGLKVFSEGEWKVRQHGVDKRRVWRKLHLAVDSATREIICVDLSHSSSTDAQALPELIKRRPTGKLGKHRLRALTIHVTVMMLC